ncbi:MAG: hypothetical protein ACP5TK_01030 [Candidatus Micrarchaeia archaeon]
MRESRAQASFEYIITYVMLFLILVLVVYILLRYASLSSTVMPYKCVFDYGINCVAVLVASNSTSTVVALLGTNMLEYELAAPELNATIGGKAYSTNCIPNGIKPGQLVMCILKLPKQLPVGSYTQGSLIFSAENCGMHFGACKSGIMQKFDGNYSTNTKLMLQPKIGLVLSKSANVTNMNNTIKVDIALDVLGYMFTVQNPIITSSNPYISIIYNSTQPGVAYISSNGTIGNTSITFSYAGFTANTSVKFVPAGEDLFVTNFASGNVTLVNTSSGNISNFADINMPSSDAITNAGQLYVADAFDNRIYVLNTTSATTVADIGVGTLPMSVATDNANGRAYVANAGSGNVTVIDTQTKGIIGNIKVGYYPDYVAVSGNGNTVFVLNLLSGSISVINASTDQVTSTIQLEHIPFSLASNYNGSEVFVTEPAVHEVALIAVKTGKVLANFTIGSLPAEVAYGGSNIYVTDISNSKVYIVNSTSGSVEASANTGLLPLFITLYGKNVYVADSGTNNVDVLNTTSDAVSDMFNTGLFPSSIAVMQS